MNLRLCGLCPKFTTYSRSVCANPTSWGNCGVDGRLNNDHERCRFKLTEEQTLTRYEQNTPNLPITATV